jgi:hypothetical protein
VLQLGRVNTTPLPRGGTDDPAQAYLLTVEARPAVLVSHSNGRG